MEFGNKKQEAQEIEELPEAQRTKEETNILRSKHVTGISCPYVYCGLASESSTAFTPATNPNVDIIASAAPAAGRCDSATIVAALAICMVLWSSNTRSRIHFESETQPRRTHVVRCWAPLPARLFELG